MQNPWPGACRKLCATLAAAACMGASIGAAESPPPGTPPEMRMDDIVRDRLYPQLDYFFEKLLAEKGAVTIDGVAAFNGNDKFLPGKIAVGLSHLLIDTPRDDPRFARYIK